MGQDFLDKLYAFSTSICCHHLIRHVIRRRPILSFKRIESKNPVICSIYTNLGIFCANYNYRIMENFAGFLKILKENPRGIFFVKKIERTLVMKKLTIVVLYPFNIFWLLKFTWYQLTLKVLGGGGKIVSPCLCFVLLICQKWFLLHFELNI